MDPDVGPTCPFKFEARGEICKHAEYGNICDVDDECKLVLSASTVEWL